MSQSISSLEYSAGFIDGVHKGYEIAIDIVNKYRKDYFNTIICPEGLHPSPNHETSYNDQTQIVKRLESYDPIDDMECRVNFTYKRG